MIKYKTVLIIPHFGEFKNYFNFFLKSCKNNKNIDFIFFTDNKKYLEQENIYMNIKFVQISFDEIKIRIQNLFDFEISLDKPYKICDYRPAFGLIFKDYLVDYHYWGHCDNDMILGDIDEFLGDLINSNKYQRILRHGHLSIYKNDEFTNNLFKSKFKDIVEYKKAFTTKNVIAFDEAGAKNYKGTAHIWLNHYREKLYENLKIFSNPLSNKRFFRDNQNKGYLRYYKYSNGKLYNCFITKFKKVEIEILYLHLFRRNIKFEISDEADSFLIVPNKIIKFSENLSSIRRFVLTFKPIFYWEYYFSRIKNKILNKLMGL